MKILIVFAFLFTFSEVIFGCEPIYDVITTRDVTDNCSIFGSEGSIQVVERYAIRWSDNQVTSSSDSDFRGYGKCNYPYRCEPTLGQKQYENHGVFGRFSLQIINMKFAQGGGTQCAEDFRVRKGVKHTCQSATASCDAECYEYNSECPCYNGGGPNGF